MFRTGKPRSLVGFKLVPIQNIPVCVSTMMHHSSISQKSFGLGSLSEGTESGCGMFEDDDSEVLPCPTLHDVLTPISSPFVKNNYHGGGFVSPDDRVHIQAVHFSSRLTAGVRSQGKDTALSTVPILAPCYTSKKMNNLMHRAFFAGFVLAENRCSRVLFPHLFPRSSG